MQIFVTSNKKANAVFMSHFQFAAVIGGCKFYFLEYFRKFANLAFAVVSRALLLAVDILSI